jgi:phosphinothricin acetyltransferase
VSVRDATPADLPAVAAIYAAAARTPATFDLDGHAVAWWEDVLAAGEPAAGHWLLVAADAAGVVGYARSTRHKDRPAYATTVETSVYVAEDQRGRGVGDALYSELLDRLDASGLRLAVAGITQPNDPSNRLHRAHGFRAVGTFTGVGVKLGRAWDVLWFQRPLRAAPPLDGRA